MRPHDPKLTAAVAWTAFAVFVLLLLILATEPEANPRAQYVPTVECDNAHFKQYEDGSGVLSCGKHPVLRVHVTR